MAAFKKYRYMLLFSVLSLLCLAFIFGHSLMPARASLQESDQVIQVVKPIIDPQDQMTYKEANFLVRKSAHLTEFAVLGLCIGGLCAALSSVRKQPVPFLGLFLTLAAAVTDEFIQSFLDRSSMVEDILIDFAGSAVGLLAVFLVVRLTARIRKKR